MISAEEIIPTTKRILEEFRAVRNAVSQSVIPSTACFENVVQPLIDVENRVQGELGVIAMLRYATPDQAAREASDEAVRLMGESDAEFTAREDLYLLIKAVTDKAEHLDVEAAKFLATTLTDFRRCGHGVLNGDQIKSYLNTRNEIDNLRSEFNRNIRDEGGGLWCSLEELDGVPEEDISLFPEGDEKGTRFVPFRKAELESIMKYARNPLTRKKMYVGDAHKLAQNLSIFRDVIIRRDQNARLLGYGSHAAYRLEKRVAKSPAWVNRLLDELEDNLAPQGKQEMQALQERKRAYLAENTDYPQEDPDTMPPWDYAYYSRLALEDLQVDHAKISEYFPLRNTVPAMLEVFTSCLQLRFVPVPPEVMDGSQWHEDV
jgi:metallopeptidase MepB